MSGLGIVYRMCLHEIKIYDMPLYLVRGAQELYMFPCKVRDIYLHRAKTGAYRSSTCYLLGHRYTLYLHNAYYFCEGKDEQQLCIFLARSGILRLTISFFVGVFGEPRARFEFPWICPSRPVHQEANNPSSSVCEQIRFRPTQAIPHSRSQSKVLTT